MIEREYVKLNTSIQTASNAEGLTEDANGNIEAVIDLRLPENLFSKSVGSKNIDTVTMQTSKMRLSLQNTPIAQLPRDTILTTTSEQLVSTCQLDIYPYSVADGNQLMPSLLEETAFPHYKDHNITLDIVLMMNEEQQETVDTFTFTANGGAYGFPRETRFYSILHELGVLKDVSDHPMNLWYENNHGLAELQPSSFTLQSVPVLEQVLQDAVENAVSYAACGDTHHIRCFFVPKNIYDGNPSAFPDLPITDKTVLIPEYVGDTPCYYWKWEEDESEREIASYLRCAFKPRIVFGDESLKLSYDTAPFTDNIPVIVSQGYIDTYDRPETMTLDKLRNSVWSQPPPKRAYQYGVSDETTSYSYSLLQSLTCSGMSLIGNEAMKQTFPFLPWKTIVPADVPQLAQKSYAFKVETTRTNTNTTSTRTVTQFVYRDHIPSSPESNPAPAGALVYSRLPPQADARRRIGIAYRYNYWSDIGDSPADRLAQQLYALVTPGEEEEREIPNIELITTGPTTTETITVLDSYHSNDPNLVTGETVIYDTSDGGTHINGPTPYRDPLDVEEVVFFAQTVDVPEPGTRVWTLGVPVGYTGEWGRRPSGVQRYVPSFPPSELSETADNPPDPGNPNHYLVRAYCVWELEQEEVHAIAFEHITGRCSTSYITEETRDRVVRTVSSVGSESPILDLTSVKYVPNLVLEDDETFYILDGNAVNVSIAAPEVVQEARYVYKITDVEAYVSGTKVIAPGWDMDSEHFDLNNPQKTRVLARVNSKPYEYHGHFFQHVFFYEYCLKQDWWGTPEEDIPQNRLKQNFYWMTDDPIAEITTSIPGSIGYDISQPKQEIDLRGEISRTVTYSSEGVPTHEVSTQTIRQQHVENITEGDETFTTYRFRVLDPRNGEPVWVDAVLSDGATYLPSQSPQPFYYPPTRYAWIVDRRGSGSTPELAQKYGASMLIVRYIYCFPNDEEPNMFYVRGKKWTYGTTTVDAVKQSTHDVEYAVDQTGSDYRGNVRLSFEWSNLPMVIISPIASFILVFQGLQLTSEIQPVNIDQPGGASLTTTVPVVENFYSLATTLRDLHDELVVTRDNFETYATYSLSKKAGLERTIRISAKYLAKAGTLHQVYIPKTGVFSVQLTFALSMYQSS